MKKEVLSKKEFLGKYGEDWKKKYKFHPGNKSGMKLIFDSFETDGLLHRAFSPDCFDYDTFCGQMKVNGKAMLVAGNSLPESDEGIVWTVTDGERI